MTTESQRYNCFTRNGGNAIPKHAGPEAKGSNLTAGLALLWAHNPFRGNFNHWQVSWKEAQLHLPEESTVSHCDVVCSVLNRTTSKPVQPVAVLKNNTKLNSSISDYRFVSHGLKGY